MLIFGAREFLATDVMLAGIAVIGIIGLALEKLVFQRLERVHRRALGHDDVMSGERTRSILRGTVTIIVVAALYEATARSGYFRAP